LAEPGPVRIRRASNAAARRGLTLVELLVVVFVFTILAAIAVPQLHVAMEDRRTREAARAVTVALASARNQAMATGRPVGVVFRRATELGAPNACTVVEQTESPAPYSGENTDAGVRLQLGTVSTSDRPSATGPPGYPAIPVVYAQLGPNASAFNLSTIRIGDQMQINHQGPWYTIIGPDGDYPADPDGNDDGVPDTGTLILGREPFNRYRYPWPESPDVPPWSPWLPYQIRRQPRSGTNDPILGSAMAPIQLPSRAAVDLSVSGPDGQPFAFAGTTGPVMIMFGPTGAVTAVYNNGVPVNTALHEPAYLLVGELQRVPRPTDPAGLAEDGVVNIDSFKSIWVTIQPRTGLASAAEMAPTNGVDDDGDGDIDELDEAIDEKRRFARENLGGL
jgi:prepilin-type N-terminal cleavage/methylation domain-containing protein